MFQNLEARAMEFILMASAVAVDNQPGQEVYLGPMVNLTLNDETCPTVNSILFRSEGFIEEQPRGDYIVIPNECSMDFGDVDTSKWRWQSQELGRIACNCRNDYPAWLTLEGGPVTNPGICQSFETAYGWLYGEPTETIKWMTVPPQYNISIPNAYSGQEFENPDFPADPVNPLICNSTSIIQKANQ